MTRTLILRALAGVVLLTACDKTAVQELGGPEAGSRIKFFNFGVNAPSVNFYANTTKMTAVLSTTGTEGTNGVGYGGVAAGGFYSSIAPGQYSLQGKISTDTDKDLTIANVSATLADGKIYSFYMSGFYNTTSKSVDGFVVEDAMPADIDFSVAYVRFVHAISNANPLTMYATNTTTAAEVPVGATVAYKAGGAFTPLPAGSYNLATRYAGVSTNAIARTGVAFAAGRVYTIAARGDITITSTTAANRPFLDFTSNR